jgi:hypothetical protein
MNKPIQPQRQTSEEHAPERRRTKRIPLCFYIQVSGFTSDGQFFRDLTVTTDVSEGGCRFELAREIELKAPITIQVVHSDGSPPPGSKPLLFEVARIEPSSPGWSVGAAMLQSENIWNMTFPINRAWKSSQ